MTQKLKIDFFDQFRLKMPLDGKFLFASSDDDTQISFFHIKFLVIPRQINQHRKSKFNNCKRFWEMAMSACTNVRDSTCVFVCVWKSLSIQQLNYHFEVNFVGKFN